MTGKAGKVQKTGAPDVIAPEPHQGESTYDSDMDKAFAAVGATSLDQHLAAYTRYFEAREHGAAEQYAKKYAKMMERDAGRRVAQRQVVIAGMIATLRAVLVADYLCDEPTVR